MVLLFFSQLQFTIFQLFLHFSVFLLFPYFLLTNTFPEEPYFSCVNAKIIIVQFTDIYELYIIKAMPKYCTEEPIYALATPFSPSALAILRASGNSVHSMLAPFFSNRIKNEDRNQMVHGYIKDENGVKIDEVMVLLYPHGHGYTGEEAFEVISHGSLATIKGISKVLEKAGLRKALPGEFTYRAFLHGRMDLTEAEAVEEIVKSRSEKSSQEALMRLSGSIKDEADKAKNAILDILSSLEVYLDYGEDEIIDDWVFPIDRVNNVINRLSLIRDTYKAARLYSQGAIVVLAGKTNAGKSSLFNALLKENRAIVSEEEGTTRDFLESAAEIEGVPVRLFDTAGLRDAENAIEREGIKRSKDLMKRADLIVYVLDGDEKEREADARTLYVHSKKDLTHSESRLSFSSVTGDGIGEVAHEIYKRLTRDIKEIADVPTIESERQKEKLDEAIKALEDAKGIKDESEDVLALYFQSALSALGELTGEITSDDILDHLFSNFCLGK